MSVILVLIIAELSNQAQKASPANIYPNNDLETLPKTSHSNHGPENNSSFNHTAGHNLKNSGGYGLGDGANYQNPSNVKHSIDPFGNDGERKFEIKPIKIEGAEPNYPSDSTENKKSDLFKPSLP